MSDLDGILRSIGVTDDQVSGLFGDIDDDDVQGLILTEEDVGAVIRRAAPSVSQQDASRLAHVIHKRTAPLERVYAAAASARIAETNMRPNTPIGLYATNLGTACTANTVYTLAPRVNGALAGTPMEFTTTMSFFQMMADARDAAAGFHLVANTVGFGDDVAKGIRFDVPLTSFQHQVKLEQSPMASLFKRSPRNNVRFTASVYFEGAALSTAYFNGITLITSDTACRNAQQQLLDNLEDLNFGGVARSIMDRVRQRFPLRAGAPAGRRPQVKLSGF